MGSPAPVRGTRSRFSNRINKESSILNETLMSPNNSPGRGSVSQPTKSSSSQRGRPKNTKLQELENLVKNEITEIHARITESVRNLEKLIEDKCVNCGASSSMAGTGDSTDTGASDSDLNDKVNLLEGKLDN